MILSWIDASFVDNQLKIGNISWYNSSYSNKWNLIKANIVSFWSTISRIEFLPLFKWSIESITKLSAFLLKFTPELTTIFQSDLNWNLDSIGPDWTMGRLNWRVTLTPILVLLSLMWPTTEIETQWPPTELNYANWNWQQKRPVVTASLTTFTFHRNAFSFFFFFLLNWY